MMGRHGDTRSQAPTWRSTALMLVRGFLVIVGLVFSGPAWATAAVVGGAATDGYPAEYYDGGNRAAFFWSWMLLMVTCPLASMIAFGFARWVNWSTWRSLGAAQLGAAIFAVPVLVVLS